MQVSNNNLFLLVEPKGEICVSVPLYIYNICTYIYDIYKYIKQIRYICVCTWIYVGVYVEREDSKHTHVFKWDKMHLHEGAFMYKIRCVCTKT